MSDLNLDTESIVCFSTDYAREQLENDGAHDFLPYVIFVKKKRKGLLYEITAFADPFDMIDDIGLQTFLDKTARKSICETLRKRKYVLACLIWIDELSNALKYSGGLIRTETHDKTGVVLDSKFEYHFHDGALLVSSPIHQHREQGHSSKQ